MNIGKSRERVKIQSPSDFRTPTGEATISWTDLATVWASVEGLSTREVLQAQQANLVATHKVRIRYRADTNHTCRLVWRTREMEVASVVERENRTVLEILAREVQ